MISCILLLSKYFSTLRIASLALKWTWLLKSAYLGVLMQCSSSPLHPTTTPHPTPLVAPWGQVQDALAQLTRLLLLLLFKGGGIPARGTSEVSELSRAVNIRDFSPSPSFAFASKQKFLSFSLSLFLSISISFSFWLYHRKILSCLKEEEKNPERCLLSYEHLDVGGDEFHQMNLWQNSGPILQFIYKC